MMESSSRRKILKGGISGLSLIAGFPQLFSPALANNDPPKSTKATKKTVSPSKPTTKKQTKPTKPTKPTKRTDRPRQDQKENSDPDAVGS
jgi:hypothetical protein